MCQTCGQKYLNDSDLNNHTAQHEGITYNYDTCLKTFYSRKSFDTHNKGHVQGLFICNQCGKTFDYEGSLQNHVLKHKGIVYHCDVQGCAHISKSKAMHREHKQYGHTEG